MATYSAIAGSELAVNKPLTASLMSRLSDNPIAIFEQMGFAATTKVFTSAETPWVANTTTVFPHSLSQQPLIVQPWIICTTAEYGYAIGDKVLLPMFHNPSDGRGYGYAVWLNDTTNVEVHTGTYGPGLYNRTTGAYAIGTVANWSLYVRAWG